jgi:3-methyladenine DNA glycosylase/8-oxoguanine DNA glycosylase
MLERARLGAIDGVHELFPDLGYFHVTSGIIVAAQMTTADYAKARRMLARRDPILATLMRAHGPCKLADRQHTDPFKALIRAIISQQLSTKAAATQ